MKYGVKQAGVQDIARAGGGNFGHCRRRDAGRNFPTLREPDWPRTVRYDPRTDRPALEGGDQPLTTGRPRSSSANRLSNSTRLTFTQANGRSINQASGGP